MDHTNLNDMQIFEQNPSAERIAHYIYDAIVAEMKETGVDLTSGEGKKSAFLYAVDVFETDRNRARYFQ
jgi:6-pyruvoyltetrahydropterin/6-carboxytetrahydropterin synthase